MLELKYDDRLPDHKDGELLVSLHLSLLGLNDVPVEGTAESYGEQIAEITADPKFPSCVFCPDFLNATPAPFFPTYGGIGFEPSMTQDCMILGLAGDMGNPKNPKGNLDQWLRLNYNYKRNPSHSAVYGGCLGFCGGEDPFIYHPLYPEIQFRPPGKGMHHFLRCLEFNFALVSNQHGGPTVGQAIRRGTCPDKVFKFYSHLSTPKHKF